ncbi:hypothetical protein FOZ61_002059, partial [Perkinsus olseni]
MFKYVLGLLGIKKSKASVYHPAGNGLVERFNQTFLQLLRVHVSTTYDWLGHLNSIVWHYNTSIHSSTRASPFYLMYGREPPSLWFPQLNHTENMLYDPEAYARYIAHVRAVIADSVDQLTTKAASAYKASFDAKAKKRLFTIGLRVRLETLGPLRANKLSPRWEADWFVSALLPGLEDKTVEIVHPATNRRKVVSVDHLLVDPLQPRDLPPEVRVMIPALTGPLDLPEVLVEEPELPHLPAPQVPIMADFSTTMTTDSLVDPPRTVPVGQETSRVSPGQRQLPASSSSSSAPQGSSPSTAPPSREELREGGEGREESDKETGDHGPSVQALGENGLRDRGPVREGVVESAPAAESSVNGSSSSSSSEGGPPALEPLSPGGDPSSTSSSPSESPGSVLDPADDVAADPSPEYLSAVSEEDDLESEVDDSDNDDSMRAVASSTALSSGPPPPDWQLARDRPRRAQRPPARFSPSASGRRFKTVPRHENGCRRLDFDSVVNVDFVGYAINEVCFEKDQRDGHYGAHQVLLDSSVDDKYWLYEVVWWTYVDYNV